MPRLWLDYLTLFVHPACPPTISKTHARRTFDRALRTLPPSLHLHIWRWYLRWAEICGSEVAQRVWCRYLRIDSSLSEPYVAMLLEMPEQLRIADGHANNIDGSIARHDEDEKDDDDDDSLTPVQERRVLEAAKRMLALARSAWTGEYTSPNGKSPYPVSYTHLTLPTKRIV